MIASEAVGVAFRLWWGRRSVFGSEDEARQDETSREVLAAVRPFLGGPTEVNAGWRFEFGEHLESNWGAVYGGAVAAGALSLARCATPDRSPSSMHIQMVRSIPSGDAFGSAEVRHAGRTVATVEVDLFDGRNKLAAIALITMVTPTAVAAGHRDTTARPFAVQTAPFDPPPPRAPMQRSLQTLREKDGVPLRGFDDQRLNVDGTPSQIGRITVPFDRLDITGPETACLAADAIVAAPVLQSFVPASLVGPNPDLSLRFTDAAATPVVETSGIMLSVQHGTATTAIEVQAGGHQLAQGLSTSLLLPTERS
jgi:acyl-coenzyme A thioesterase PaaI-like protein